MSWGTYLPITWRSLRRRHLPISGRRTRSLWLYFGNRERTRWRTMRSSSRFGSRAWENIVGTSRCGPGIRRRRRRSLTRRRWRHYGKIGWTNVRRSGRTASGLLKNWSGNCTRTRWLWWRLNSCGPLFGYLCTSWCPCWSWQMGSINSRRLRWSRTTSTRGICCLRRCH